jgi:D-3-phosphoglycerate dehydrogenase
MSDRILVTLSTFAQWDQQPLTLLEQSGYPLAFNTTGKRISRSALLELGRNASVVIAGVEEYDAGVLGQMPALRCISRCGVGTDNVDLRAAHQRGITVLNTPEPPAAAVAELAVTMMLALLRRLPQQIAAARRHEWTRLEAGLLGARSVGIVGLGRIGRRVAYLVRGFGATVAASDPAPDYEWADRNGVRMLPLRELLAASDILSIHAALASEQPLIGGTEIGHMKRGAILINLARGGIVDEVALHAAALSGQIGGIGLDVYREEPYSGPLCDVENAILTPHSATLTVETRSAMELECVDKALRFLRGGIRAEELVA